jgi:hypothetical protein
VDKSIVSHVHLRLLSRCAQNYGAGEKSSESAEASPRLDKIRRQNTYNTGQSSELR